MQRKAPAAVPVVLCFCREVSGVALVHPKRGSLAQEMDLPLRRLATPAAPNPGAENLNDPGAYSPREEPPRLAVDIPPDHVFPRKYHLFSRHLKS